MDQRQRARLLERIADVLPGEVFEPGWQCDFHRECTNPECRRQLIAEIVVDAVEDEMARPA